MKRHRISAAAALLATLSSAPAMAGGGVGAGHGGAYYDYAKVLDVEPLVTVVQVPTERRECWDERVAVPAPRRVGHQSYTPVIVGGIVGGVVGNRFGKGSGRDLMTVAGALLGGAVGHDMARAHHHETPGVRTERHCKVSTEYIEDERIDGYRVTYRYRGHTFIREMDSDPGARLPVLVSVEPRDS